MAFETWLTEEDTERLWAVVEGNLPDYAATTAELEEFERLVTHAAMIKIAGENYQAQTIH